MDLYLQLGFGMMEHALTLLGDWGNGGAILSPRDLTDEQLHAIGPRIAKVGVEVLLDPQCFLRDADHYRLTKHAYWNTYKAHTTAEFAGLAATRSLLEPLIDLNHAISCGRFIAPGLLATPVTEEWFAFHDRMVTEAAEMCGGERTLQTVALGQEAVRSEDQIEAVVERVAAWPCAGVYLVCETPGRYLVDEPAWLANLLILASGLRLAGKTVLVGYCHHQMLALAAAGVGAIPSVPTWLRHPLPSSLV